MFCTGHPGHLMASCSGQSSGEGKQSLSIYLEYYKNAFFYTKSDNLLAKNNGTKSYGIDLSLEQVTACKSSDFVYNRNSNIHL